MATVRIQLNSAGFKKLARDPSVSGIEGHARNIAARAGDGFEVAVDIGPNRARASVYSATAEAMLAEAVHQALTRAVG